ncbi:hypothetical protein DKX38_002800 [Salix brachista]|uniref:Uncharacterized protein n=1 Tax=Salix brachista TaxID=2182728 RepID=A0A5N5NPN2_9ROSI|nr:hypothetical protein DKX38_002800 [Salix brachista]
MLRQEPCPLEVTFEILPEPEQHNRPFFLTNSKLHNRIPGHWGGGMKLAINVVAAIDTTPTTPASPSEDGSIPPSALSPTAPHTPVTTISRA